jgi:hypothetical protein
MMRFSASRRCAQPLPQVHHIKQDLLWEACTLFERHGGINIPRAGVTIVPAHCVAGPYHGSYHKPTASFHDVVYLSIFDSSMKGKRIFVAEEYFDGGMDIALLFDEKPNFDFECSKNKIIEVLRECSVSRDDFVVPQQVVVTDVHGRSLPVCMSRFDERNSNYLLTDVGYPGLSGSPVFLLSDRTKLVGMYTARLSSSDRDARAAKFDDVVSTLRMQNKDTVQLAAEANSALMEIFNVYLNGPSSAQPPAPPEAHAPAAPHATAALPVYRETPLHWGSMLIQRLTDRQRPILDAIRELQQDMKDMKQDMKDMKQDMKAMKQDMKQLGKKIDAVEKNMKQDMKDMKQDMKQLGKKVDLLSADHNDLLRRRAVALPVADVLGTVSFNEWHPHSWRYKACVQRVHAFDSRTDCDVGIPQDG